jgi:hypothetical protein
MMLSSGQPKLMVRFAMLLPQRVRRKVTGVLSQIRLPTLLAVFRSLDLVTKSPLLDECPFQDDH